ncbi:MAG TPA: nuclear transport factor 2 family protein [Phenylobacterium sp.]|nr:nuclear transport factor 2 family protein [Phenylobacterium sp.]
MTADPAQELLDLERRRCEAIATLDIPALRQILSEDYVHVHVSGKIDDVEGHIAAITRRPRTPSRGALSVRCYGDAAVVTGEQVNSIGTESSVTVVQQIAIRQQGRWRFVSTMVTRKATEV